MRWNKRRKITVAVDSPAAVNKIAESSRAATEKRWKIAEAVHKRRRKNRAR